MGPPGANLGPSWGQLGPSRGPHRAVLGLSWSNLEALVSHLGAILGSRSSGITNN